MRIRNTERQTSDDSFNLLQQQEVLINYLQWVVWRVYLLTLLAKISAEYFPCLTIYGSSYFT